MQKRRSIARRFERNYVRLPVNLVASSPAGAVEQLGSIVDLSQGGMRVVTRRSLSQGQPLEVFLRGIPNPYAFCRVVWSRTQGNALPSEAGLEIVAEARAADEAEYDFISELREVYHNPATSR